MVIKLTWGIKNALIYEVFKHIGYFTLTYIFRNKYRSWVKATFILVENIGFSRNKQTRTKHFISYKHCHLILMKLTSLNADLLFQKITCMSQGISNFRYHYAFDEGMLRRQFNLVFWHHIVIGFEHVTFDKCKLSIIYMMVVLLSLLCIHLLRYHMKSSAPERFRRSGLGVWQIGIRAMFIVN